MRTRPARAAAQTANGRARLGDDHLVKLDALAAISETALTRDTAIEIADTGLPTTFVPGRNLMFFCFAGALAYRRGARHMVAGMCETDYSGYPDCRDDTMKAMQVALSLGLDKRVTIHTPLMWIDKAETFAMAEEPGRQPLLDLVIEESHSCYLGDRSTRHNWGYGCGDVPGVSATGQGFEKFSSRRKDTMTPQRSETQQHRGDTFLALFCLTIPAANWLIGHAGTVCASRWSVPSAGRAGLMAPSGVLMIGAALVLRDLVQRRLGATSASARSSSARYLGRARAAVTRGGVGGGLPAIGIRRFRRLHAARPPSAGGRGRCVERCRPDRRLYRVPVAGVRLTEFPIRSDHR